MQLLTRIPPTPVRLFSFFTAAMEGGLATLDTEHAEAAETTDAD